jgi:hypothetical protein
MAKIADPNSVEPGNVAHQAHPSEVREASVESNGSRSRARQTRASSSSTLHQSLWREDIPPTTQLDADDRRDGRATTSPDSLALQIQLEKHRNWLQWQQVFRGLVFYGGIIGLTATFAFMLDIAHFSSQESAHILTYGLISALGGYGIRSLATKLLSRSSRGRKENQDQSLS